MAQSDPFAALMFKRLTKLSSFLALRLVDDTIGALAHDANNLVLVHPLSISRARLIIAHFN